MDVNKDNKKRDNSPIFGVIFHFSASRDKQDPEKSVLPMILFINTNHPFFTNGRRKGFMLAFGWWDWSVKFWFVSK